MKYFKHPAALVESEHIGEGTRIWAFAHVMEGARIGSGCNIGDHSFIESGAVIGNNVTIKNGVAIWDRVTIEDRVFLGPYAVLTNDLWPRSRSDWVASETFIREGATIGANATVVCGIEIGSYAMIGAGSVVTRDVPAHALVYGSPARVRGWVCHCATKLSFDQEGKAMCPKCSRRFRKQDDRVEFIGE